MLSCFHGSFSVNPTPVKNTISFAPFENAIFGVSQLMGTYYYWETNCWGAANSATLPETNSSPLKFNGWKIHFLSVSLIFGAYVSFREGKANSSYPVLSPKHQALVLPAVQREVPFIRVRKSWAICFYQKWYIMMLMGEIRRTSWKQNETICKMLAFCTLSGLWGCLPSTVECDHGRMQKHFGFSICTAFMKSSFIPYIGIPAKVSTVCWQRVL